MIVCALISQGAVYDHEIGRRSDWREIRHDSAQCGVVCLADVLDNLVVLLAALGVFGTRTGWPDVIVAAIMAALALQGAATVACQAFSELRLPLNSPAEQPIACDGWPPNVLIRHGVFGNGETHFIFGEPALQT